MFIFTYRNDIRDFISRERSAGRKVGFVPTMGALHKGHLSLIERARRENDCVVCSIFVNPIQFNDPADLTRYPRTLERDLVMLDTAGCDVVFVPTALEMYPVPPTEDDRMHFGDLELVMEGAARPGHFSGVGIVVKKLFETVIPHRAYFGEKDFQQLAVIRQMVGQFHLPVDIVGCPIVREEDGLAMSSRNTLLTPEERKNAANIYSVLKEAREKAPGNTPGALQELVRDRINAVQGLELEYFEVADPVHLKPAPSIGNSPLMGFIVVKAGKVRLLDNISLID